MQKILEQLSFQPVENHATVLAVASLAREIWLEHYPAIIGKLQVEYMLKRFQSVEALEEQIEAGYKYFLVLDTEHKVIGYCAIAFRAKELFISKLYILCASRGKGYARQIMDFIEGQAREHNLHRVTLTVNKHNANSIKVYQQMGFSIYKSYINDIGNGFTMDDYAMEKLIS